MITLHRKPIQIAVMSRKWDPEIVVLCDDGTIWKIVLDGNDWEQLIDVPQHDVERRDR